MNNQDGKAILKISVLGFPWPVEDPFLFCAYHNDDYPLGNDAFAPLDDISTRPLGSDFTLKDGYRMYHGKTVPGFPAHPHCGFETVTIVEQGFVDHSDSLGASARYGMGDVQWLTTGSGIMHSEMFPLLDKENRNPLELFQLWLNLPAKDKRVSANFAMYWADEIAVLPIAEHSHIKLVAGTLGDLSATIRAPMDSFAYEDKNDVVIALITLKAGESYVLPKAAMKGVNRNLFFYEGRVCQVDEKLFNMPVALKLDAETESVSIKAMLSDCKFLLLQGRPINEPVAQHGPFVMNRQDELIEMFNEYQRTQFGGWTWGRSDPVHGSEKTRFAKTSEGISKPTEI